MHSAIYRGYLRHRRHHPHGHRFCYPIFLMYLDLDELDAVLAISPLWSRKAWRPARFERRDFLGDPALPLADAVRERIREQTGQRHEGPIRLLANLRYFGYNINPIACYYCFDSAEQLRYIVAEVTNTPWGERQSYVLECDPGKRIQQIEFHKLMHVSPFNPMQMTYRWRSNRPAEILSLNLDAEQAERVHVDATLALRRHEIDARGLAAVLLRYPWMTARVAFTIYWQALKLWLRRTPFYDHPATRGDEMTSKLKTKT